MNSDSSLKKHHPGRNRARRRFSMFSVLSLALLLAIFLAALGAVLPARATPWYVRDQFATNAFNNQNGNVNWASDWTEINDTGGATGGNVQVTGGELRVNSRIVTNDPDFEGVQRSVNLSTAATATLSFTFRTTNLEADDTLSVDVYNGSTWTTLETLSGSSTGARRTYDITAYRNANSAIRFQITANFDQTNESIFFDNVEVSYTVGGSHTSASVLQTVQTYYIPVPENQALDVLDSINAAAVSPTSVYLSITVNADGTVIYYDHWEDGFETRINDPIQATTDVWGDNNPANGMPPGYATDYLQAGDVIILNNVVDVTGWPASLVIKYDGGDKIASTEAIAVTRTSWASGSNTLHAGSIEMLDISVWGERFDMPADTDDQANDFDYAGLAVMASVDGTQIYLNGSLVTTINEGQSYLFADNTINGGDRVTTNAGHPVQAAFLTGDIGSNYESSWFTLYPYDLLGTSYYSVVPGFATPARTTRVFIENPNTNTITVHYQFYGGSEQTIDVPSYATVSIVVPTTPGTGGRFWTTDGSRFQAISVIDSGGQAADWGYTLVPENQLTQQAQVGWGAGQDPTLPLTENGSPVWVMAVGSGTMYVCADYNGDGLGALTDNNGHHYDQLLTLNSLQQAKVYDSDGDQTGMLLYLCNGSESANNRGNNIAVAWGQDPTRASTGAPGLDVGTTVPPLPNFTAIKGATLITDINGDGKFDVGETFEYVIRVSNVGAIPIPPNTITVEDIIPAYTTYVPNSTRVDGVLVPDNTSGTPFPLDEGGIIIDKVLPIEGRFLITFQVVINTDIPSTQTIQNNARVSGLDLLYDPHVEIVVDPPTKLGDRIWLDLDGDGVQDAGEPGIPGVTVELYNGSCVIGSTCPTQVTNANGQYTFSGLIDNTYTVIVRTATLPGGLTQTGDPDGCPGAGCDNQHQVTIGPGNTNKPYWNADFGYRGNVSIGDFVWYDIDRDGVQDGGAEVGLSGVTVILTWAGPDNDLATTGDNITLTTTTSGGAYLFSGLPAGTYRVDLDENTLPAGYAPTTTDPLILNNLAAGTNYTAADFGAAPGASIGNLVWNDMDNDGNQDPGESGISGVRVYIDANGNGSYDPGERYAITDANGAYLIDRLAAGSYVVRVDPATVPPNMVLTTANIPLAVILSAGEAYTTADFGYRSTALAMVKTSDAGASVLPGDDVLYTLTVVNNSSIIQTGIAVTDPLPAETSYVPNSTIASGYVASFYSDSFTSGDFSGSGVGSLAWAGDWQETDSTGAGPAAGAIRVVNAPACPNGQCLRFQLVNAGDLIYRQADLSIPACTAPGATVALQYRYNNQLAGANDQLQVRIYTGTTQRRTVATYTSANQGSGTVYFPLVANEIANDTRVQLMRINDNDVNYFYFDDVSFVCLNSATRDNAPGGYPDLGNGTPPILVRLEDGFALPPGGTMTVTYHVTVDADTGGATHITNIGQTTSIQNIYPQQASVSDPIAGWIRGQVRYDIDMDGVLNETPPEPGLAGAQVALYTDPNGDGDPSDGVQVGSTITTDPSGNYVFSDVLPGNYVVVEINPPGYASTADSAGANDDRIPVVLTAGANSTGNDFLDTNMVIISDLVWNDRNADGIQDPDGLDDILGTADDEVGIDGVTVRLLDGSGTQVATTTTSGGGLYSFIVPAGTYRVDFVLPVGYVFSPANQGSDDALDSDADPITGETANYTLAAGVTNATIDAGMYLANPALNVIKEVSAAAGGPWSHSITVNAGDTVYYRVRVQNTGNITLTGLTVDDGMAGCTLTRGADAPGDNDADFEVGETWVYTCSLTAAAGSHTNTATADTNETDPDTDDAEYFGNAPALNVIKEVSAAAGGPWSHSITVNAGDTVYYRVRVQNTGNITLTGLTVDDGMAGCTLTRGADAPGDNDADFEVGETWVYTCSLTAAAGSHTNTATADTNETDPDTDDAEYFGNAPLIGVAKRVVGTPVEVAAGTWEVTYQIQVRNYGNADLTALQVTDDLAAAFPPATTFTVQSLSSADFTVNWPGYNGATDTNLLAGTDALPVGASGTITLVVRVVPVSSGPFWNWAYASALPPVGPRVDDLSQDGANPDPDGDGDPTNNDQPTPVSFGPTLFDPPFGIKLLDPNNLPILRWTMVWINNSNIVAVNARVIDEIPAGTTYVAGSLNCYALTPATITTSCDYEAPTPAFPRGRIVWTGIIGPDLGATDQFTALNELYIEFSVRVDAGISEVRNEATVDSDLNGDGDPDDPGEQRVALANNRWTAAVTALPATGFAPGRVTDLSGLTPVEYAATGDLRLEIPALGVDIPIVGVPRAGETWDVTWLGNQAGWLEGTAFPSWNGNSVLTSHVYLANGLPGPFVNLSRLRWGDQIILHAYGNRYIYEVRSSRIVGPDDLSALRHEELPWLTLVTCRQYDEASSAYRYRVVVRAVLMRVTPEP